MGGKITPQTTLCSITLEPLKIEGCALATFPENEWSTQPRKNFPDIPTRFSKMAVLNRKKQKNQEPKQISDRSNGGTWVNEVIQFKYVVTDKVRTQCDINFRFFSHNMAVLNRK